MTSDTLLTANEAAWALRVSLSTLRRLVRQGKLKRYRLGGSGSSRFRPADIAAVLVLSRATEADPSSGKLP